jgi:hypothetical protein
MCIRLDYDKIRGIKQLEGASQLRKKVLLTTGKVHQDKIEFIVQENVGILNLEPSGQMIVDSDSLAFVYLADSDGDYTYLYLQKEIWPLLKKALDEKLPLYIVNKGMHKELINAAEELEYLVENIQGNSNYGKEMMENVEAVFHKQS